jgi:replicative DNA helicase
MTQMPTTSHPPTGKRPPATEGHRLIQPHNRAAETALLGAVLLYPHTANHVLADLGEGDFTDPRHRAVLTAARTVLAEGADPEPALVVAELYRQHEIRTTADRNWTIVLADLIHGGGSPSAAAHYRRALLEARLRGEALTYAERLHHTATHQSVPDMWDALNTTTTELALTLARLAEHTPPGPPEPATPRLRPVLTAVPTRHAA